jgi:integrase
LNYGGKSRLGRAFYKKIPLESHSLHLSGHSALAQIRRKELKRGVSFEVRIHRSDRPALSKSFRQLSDARAWANETEAKIDRGLSVDRKASRTRIADVCTSFAESYVDQKTGKRINEQERLRLQTLVLDLGEYSVTVLNHELVKKYISTLLVTEIPPDPRRVKIHRLYQGAKIRTYAPATVRKIYYQLKKVLEWHSREHGYQLDPHIFAGQAVPSAWAGVRTRRLEDGEEVLLYMSAEAGYEHKAEACRVIGFALETAMRAQEILLATWNDLSLDTGTLFIPKGNTKTSTARHIPLSSRAKEILREQLADRDATTDRIFSAFGNSEHLSKHFKRICFRANIQDLKFHDLRHEATSRFFERGKLSDMEIMKITGHTQYSTLQRYANLRSSDLVSKMD